MERNRHHTLPSAIMTFFLAVMMSGYFTGCTHKEEKVYRIGVSQCSAESWRWKTNDEIMREAMFHDNVEVEIRSAEDRTDKQIEDIRYFIDNDFDLIIANPNQAVPLTPIIKEAYEKGIPVITFDRRIIGDTYTTHIEVDNEEIGKSVADYAMKVFKPHPMKIIELQGDSSMSPTKKRHAGFVDEVAKYSNVQILASEYANWNPDIAAKKTDSLLDIYRDVDLIYAHSDIMAISAEKVAKEKGLSHIRFLGIDGNVDVGIKAVADSILDATFLYPTYGYKLLKTALAILEGKDSLDGARIMGDITVPPLSPVDLSNADILLQQDAVVKEDTAKIEVLKAQLDDYWIEHSAQSTLMYAAFAIAGLMLIVAFLLGRTYWQHKRHQNMLAEQCRLIEQERDKQRDLYQQLQEATQSKLAFFTNVSHDLRTPLTLIAEPVAQLIEHEDLPKERRASLLRIANKNIKILRRLIDQILDFRKYENGMLTVHLTEVKFYQVLKDWIGSFDSVLRKRDIKLCLQLSENNDFTMAIDTEKMERVVFNLMSNAIKYTPDNGRISVICHNTDKELTLTVIDTGEGIARAELKMIFERFYQVDRERPNGSGIGLALVKSFVELHGGAIEVKSEKGKGAEFTVRLPIIHLDNALIKDKVNLITADTINDELEDVEALHSVCNDDKPLMLVIDDNRDIQKLISDLFMDEYNVLTASNGMKGLRLATKYTPAIIICDVMMPEMDGLECCRILKSEISTSHIPILMLTACALDEQRLEGYESGADGYLAKPFKGNILKARCRNLIDNRKRIKDLYAGQDVLCKSGKSENTVVSTPKPTGGKDVESDFYSRFIEFIKANMSNSDLSVEDIAGKMSLSKSQLGRKIKSLTNYTPVEIIRNLRVKEARRLLTTTEKSISEIAYEVGFSLPAYFSKCFKDAYGETPSELRSRLSRDKR